MNIDETLTAKGYTPNHLVQQVFGTPRRVESITIHHWGVPGQTHDGVNRFFTAGPGTTSAHYVASDGRINCLVNPDDAAWHAGNAYGNATSIGIECRPEATDGDYAAVVDLIRHLRSIYGDVPLIPHRDWQATACPGVWDLARLDRLARNAISYQSVPTAPEGLFPMLTEQQQKDIYWQLCTPEGRAAQAKLNADAILDAPVDGLDSAGNKISTTLRTKIRYMAPNHTQLHNLVADIHDAVKDTK